MPSQLSAVWKYFTEGRDVNNVKTGICNICNEERKCTGNSTTTLWAHLPKEEREVDEDQNIDYIIPEIHIHG